MNSKNTNRAFRLWISYLSAVVLCVILGLASRKFGELLPSFIALNAGDVLWAMMIYFGFRWLLVNKRRSIALYSAIIFSFGIEINQLYQAQWINGIRRTLLGSLILGHGFLMVDLFRYAAGIFLAKILDDMMLKFSNWR